MEKNNLSAGKLLLLVILLPPIGAYFVWRNTASTRLCKIGALLYATAILYILLTVRAPACVTTIDAEKWNREVDFVSYSDSVSDSEISQSDIS